MYVFIRNVYTSCQCCPTSTSLTSTNSVRTNYVYNRTTVNSNDKLNEAGCKAAVYARFHHI
jgi:hypothetical protein